MVVICLAILQITELILLLMGLSGAPSLCICLGVHICIGSTVALVSQQKKSSWFKSQHGGSFCVYAVSPLQFSPATSSHSPKACMLGYLVSLNCPQCVCMCLVQVSLMKENLDLNGTNLFKQMKRNVWSGLPRVRFGVKCSVNYVFVFPVLQIVFDLLLIASSLDQQHYHILPNYHTIITRK